MQNDKFSHKLITFLFQGLSILCIDFLVNFITSKLFLLKGVLSNAQITLATMLLALIMFLFLLNLLTHAINWILKHAVELANQFRYTKSLMLIIIFAIYVGIFSLYHNLWFSNFPTKKDSLSLFKIPTVEKSKKHFRR
jgi:hypothetical protein